MYYHWGILVLILTTVDHFISAAKLSKSTEVQQGQPVANATDPVTPDITDYQTWPDDVQLGCRELRAKRFISDGFCTSIKPIREVVCAGQCLPIKEQNLPWWSEFTKYWAKPKLKEWRCEEAVTKLKNVELVCGNGETRTYKIKIVKSCRCKNYVAGTNRTGDLHTKRRKNKKRRKEKLRKERRFRKHKGNSKRRRNKKTNILINTSTTTHDPDSKLRAE